MPASTTGSWRRDGRYLLRRPHVLPQLTGGPPVVGVGHRNRRELGEVVGRRDRFRDQSRVSEPGQRRGLQERRPASAGSRDGMRQHGRRRRPATHPPGLVGDTSQDGCDEVHGGQLRGTEKHRLLVHESLGKSSGRSGPSGSPSTATVFDAPKSMPTRVFTSIGTPYGSGSRTGTNEPQAHAGRTRWSR
jgi:hypothetical protein